MALGRNDDETTRLWRIDIERIHGLKKGRSRRDGRCWTYPILENETTTTELLKTQKISSWWLNQPIWKR